MLGLGFVCILHHQSANAPYDVASLTVTDGISAMLRAAFTAYSARKVLPLEQFPLPPAKDSNLN